MVRAELKLIRSRGYCEYIIFNLLHGIYCYLKRQRRKNQVPSAGQTYYIGTLALLPPSGSFAQIPLSKTRRAISDLKPRTDCPGRIFLILIFLSLIFLFKIFLNLIFLNLIFLCPIFLCQLFSFAFPSA